MSERRRGRGSGTGLAILVIALILAGYFYYRSHNNTLPPLPTLQVQFTGEPLETLGAAVPQALGTLIPEAGVPIETVAAALPQAVGTLVPRTGREPEGTSLPGGPNPWGRPAKSSDCQVTGSLPDRACTPGAIYIDVTVSQLCQSGYSSSVRDVTQSEKEKVLAAYGIRNPAPGQVEIDHLVSLELGGSNDISNLWAQPASPKPGYREKDQLENFLHDQVCAGKIGLSQAQTIEATNWVQAYNAMPK